MPLMPPIRFACVLGLLSLPLARSAGTILGDLAAAETARDLAS